MKDIRNLRDDNKRERFLSDRELQQLITTVASSDNVVLMHIVLFLTYTGARKREVLDARWGDVDWENLSWRIPVTKSGWVRHIPLSTGAQRLLRDRQREQAAELQDVTTLSIFANPATLKSFVSIYYSWDTARKQAALPEVRMHDLRHSFASFLVNAGRSLYEVQELLGHADIRTTSRYAHLSRERLNAAVEVIAPEVAWRI
ncbi:site-specific integrase [Burkholderiaceae bacterium]|nr:site-specific integrase [Burkholderiaceae bacterium]